MATIRVQAEDFDPAAEAAALTDGRTDVGAVVTFTGLCRDEGGVLETLELEHYPGMAEGELARIVKEAESRWPVQGVVVIHRYGKIAPGERIVMVAVSAWHRSEAFCAAEFLMDFLKTQAPFWKRQNLADGKSGGWVEGKEADDKAAEKWTR
ncbi:MAG: molybdenum cofactor biosynthesis protein MoaE [Beijerinckiaceae bacterium]|jgi:molybdopterin synthase catalytic subunit|nr:molybdenum cofactor biosynthesis protein MoaE [Beijerinckiaceae bacterium]